jgi:hypothetical protein
VHFDNCMPTGDAGANVFRDRRGKRACLRQANTTGNFRMAAMRNLRVIGKSDFLKVASAAGAVLRHPQLQERLPSMFDVRFPEVRQKCPKDARSGRFQPLSEPVHRGVRNTITIASEQVAALELPPSSH